MTLRRIQSPKYRSKLREGLTKNSPEEIQGGFFSSKYILYTVTTKSLKFEVQRRFSDFLWLRNKLIQHYPSYYVPPMAKKQSSGTFKEEFIVERMRELEEFLNSVLDHQELRASECVLIFLKIRDKDEFAHLKGKLDKTVTKVQVLYLHALG